jgi:hypothetical protein
MVLIAVYFCGGGGRERVNEGQRKKKREWEREREKEKCYGDTLITGVFIHWAIIVVFELCFGLKIFPKYAKKKGKLSDVNCRHY